ncbi:hypothetical protein I4I84_21875 [Pseudonocardia sp. KRD-182]|uniref:hypothetical protein n=1 Tax=Pseudonocardia oceani TaxID=2792013 RepID=UPI001C49DCD0|nr:hypothetical protein [Pseudonocardia oceani]MBW0111364.1 hypothetical protein [Pseudonocardia oceani]
MSHLRPTLCLAAVLAATLGCATAPPASDVAPDPVVLVAVPGGVAASSERYGPFHEFDGRAIGFSHDELGAALAATHIGPRVTAAAGTPVVEATLELQCWGDVTAARERLATTLPRPDTAVREDLTPSAMYFRVIAGDAGGNHVVVSLLADTAQSRAMGGYSRVDAALRWVGDDWQLRVPVRRPNLHPDTTGYRLLGPTP